MMELFTELPRELVYEILVRTGVEPICKEAYIFRAEDPLGYSGRLKRARRAIESNQYAAVEWLYNGLKELLIDLLEEGFRLDAIVAHQLITILYDSRNPDSIDRRLFELLVPLLSDASFIDDLIEVKWMPPQMFGWMFAEAARRGIELPGMPIFWYQRTILRLYNTRPEGRLAAAIEVISWMEENQPEQTHRIMVPLFKMAVKSEDRPLIEYIVQWSKRNTDKCMAGGIDLLTGLLQFGSTEQIKQIWPQLTTLKEYDSDTFENCIVEPVALSGNREIMERSRCIQCNPWRRPIVGNTDAIR